MNKNTTSGFCSQCHLLPEETQLADVEEEIGRAERRLAMGMRLTTYLEQEMDANLVRVASKQEGCLPTGSVGIAEPDYTSCFDATGPAEVVFVQQVWVPARFN